MEMSKTVTVPCLCSEVKEADVFERRLKMSDSVVRVQNVGSVPDRVLLKL